MDATGVVLRQPLRFSSSSYAATAAAPFSAELKTSSVSIDVRRRRPGILTSGFCDQGHVKYYNSNFAPSSSMISGKKEKEIKARDDDKASKKMKKKQLKLLKGLSRDLSTFSQIGFGLDSDGALLDQVQGNMISEASEILLKQLQKLKAEEKEMKRKLKEEKARLKAARMQNRVVDRVMSSSGSSSSSESSSDSECGEIVDMNDLKNPKQQTNLEQVIEDATATTTLASYQVPVIASFEPNVLDERHLSSRDAEKMSEEGGLLTKIEVCMGGKCKKSGAGALLEEFQKVVGIEGSVSGCKCMGKCRDGPNVKVLADKCVNKAPLCVGVGLEDVDVIVANFLGQNNNNQVGFVAAC
ncbi:hypothetical protein CASFOL_040773 [Castilleja foliolosa]|uniref:Diacylglycerol O-acyltransferase 3, cytosolic n=1 Tax=Castilleja foliolosa TaxID=1961234 RepID=A0ABD3BCV8_9LAMI